MSDGGEKQCPICDRAVDGTSADRDFARDLYRFNCDRCGEFTITWDAAKNMLPRMPDVDRVRLCGVLRERHETRQTNTEVAHVSRESIPVLLSNAPQTFDVAIKVRKLLSGIARRCQGPGITLGFPDEISRPLAFAANEDEWVYLVEYCERRGWIEQARTDRSGQIYIRLTPEGWEERQQRPRLESIRCFVAMAFAEVMKATYDDAIFPAVRDDCGFECNRIDAKEYNGAVIDEIKAEIRQSRFVIADVTHQRNGVYYEAGFADGLGVPVIWTCEDKDADNTHFDTKHLNQIRWTSHGELQKRLRDRIIGTIGRGPLAPRTATSAS
jgi:hypothetical protein